MALSDPREPLSVVGRRASPAAQAARELLERNRVPHRWIDLDEYPLGRLLRDGPIGERSLPVVFFANGEVLEGPPAYVEPFPGEVRASAAEDYVASASCGAGLHRGLRAGQRRVGEHPDRGLPK